MHLNPMLRGWTAYFKYGCSNATFSYLRSYLWKQIVRWQERKHRRTPWKQLRRRYGIWPSDGGVTLFDPAKVSAKRYYYRGTKIRSRGQAQHEETSSARRDLRRARRSVTGTPGSGGGPEKPTDGNIDRALRADLTGSKEVEDLRRGSSPGRQTSRRSWPR
ncbi:group II intron maturase-specific domain-containing protein [Nocardia nepalensis]|uniref:group II intron maturase-specific domain-containing protein n=1 Tax=Nocardia nepalensis TaxID=3375448 RepID=UPI003B680FF2